MKLKKNAFLPPSPERATGKPMSARKQWTIVFSASVAVATFGISLTSGITSRCDVPTAGKSCPTTGNAMNVHWSYDEMAHKLVMEYSEKNCLQLNEHFTSGLSNALQTVAGELDEDASQPEL